MVGSRGTYEFSGLLEDARCGTVYLDHLEYLAGDALLTLAFEIVAREEALSQGAMYGLVLPYKRSQETEADVIGPIRRPSGSPRWRRCTAAARPRTRRA